MDKQFSYKILGSSTAGTAGDAVLKIRSAFSNDDIYTCRCQPVDLRRTDSKFFMTSTYFFSEQEISLFLYVRLVDESGENLLVFHMRIYVLSRACMQLI